MNQKEFEEIWRDGEDYVACRTSGSTGEPKEILLSKEFMRKSARRTNAFFSITEESRLHTCLDFRYIASKMMTVRADEAGCQLTSEEPSSRPLQELRKDERIDLLSVVPAQMDWILESPEAWGGIRHILVGGSAIPTMMRRRIALSGYDVWETYGMTETASHIALRKVGEEEGSFKAFDDIAVEVDDAGCLVINLPDGERLTTHDLAEMTGTGEFRILGRSDNCVISGGIKIIPEELERKLGPFIAFDYCLTSVPDAKWGERLVLAVEKPDTPLDDAIIRMAVEVRLRQYRKRLELGMKSPKEVVMVDKLPRTANGKLDRKELKRLLD